MKNRRPPRSFGAGVLRAAEPSVLLLRKAAVGGGGEACKGAEFFAEIQRVGKAEAVKGVHRRLVAGQRVHAAGILRGDKQEPAFLCQRFRLVHLLVVQSGALRHLSGGGGVFSADHARQKFVLLGGAAEGAGAGEDEHHPFAPQRERLAHGDGVAEGAVVIGNAADRIRAVDEGDGAGGLERVVAVAGHIFFLKIFPFKTGLN